MHGGESLAGPAVRLEERQLRRLRLALLGSLVLHALVLYMLPLLREASPARLAPPLLTAHLAKPKPPPEPPRIEPTPPAPPLPRPSARPAPRPAPAPTPVLAMEPKPAASEPPAFVVPAPPATPAPPPAQPVATVAPAPAASGPDPNAVARFRLELMEIARRYKRYPRIAQDNNWEGRVELRITFAESGAMSALAVKRSAGRAVLDEEAQAMIRSAQPQVTVPAALRGKAFTLEVPVEFSLKD